MPRADYPARPRRPFAPRARAALAWGLAAFACSQLVLLALVEHWAPGLRDFEYGIKWGRLRARTREAPGRPLVLFMGTSRTLNGISPAEFPADPGGTAP